MRYLQNVADLLEPAVRDTLTAVPAQPEDAGARALAIAYARQIDEARRADVLAEHVLAELAEEDVLGRANLEALRAKVELKEQLDRLGPKLLAVLESLGGTPAGRARLKGGIAANAAPSQLERLRQARSSTA